MAHYESSRPLNGEASADIFEELRVFLKTLGYEPRFTGSYVLSPQEGYQTHGAIYNIQGTSVHAKVVKTNPSQRKLSITVTGKNGNSASIFREISAHCLSH